MPSQEKSKSQSMWEAFAVVASVIINNVMGGDEEYEQPQQMAGSLFQPTQMPQVPTFMPSGLPQSPDYQTPPAIMQFPPFQPLFPRRRLGE